MELKNLTLVQAKQYFAEVMEDFPAGYVYTNPDGVKAGKGVYCTLVDVDKGEPSCIVGWILFKHGVTIEQLGLRDGTFATTAQGLQNDSILLINGNAFRYLKAAQILQDKGAPWRTIFIALNMAERF